MIVQFDVSSVGPRPVALLAPADIGAKSSQAVDTAMQTIREVGQRFVDVVQSIPRPPSDVELNFAINFDMEAGAVLAKTSVGASLTVKLTWKRDAAPESEG